MAMRQILCESALTFQYEQFHHLATKSTSTVSGWWGYHLDCFDQWIQRGSRGSNVYSATKAAYSIVRAFLDRRSETPQDPSQRHQPWHVDTPHLQ